MTPATAIVESSADPEDTMKFVEDKELWFTDGSIVIAAHTGGKDDGKTHLFKVHTSFLSMHSPVFRDMFSLPQPEDAENYNGVPIVTLPDSSQDVREFLQMLYRPMETVPSPPRKRSTSVSALVQNADEMARISGPLRLSAKYDVAILHAKLAEVVGAIWPSDLNDWYQSAWNVSDILRSTKKYHAMKDPQSAVSFPGLAICLAFEAQLPEILPAAFYALQSIYSLAVSEETSSTPNPALSQVPINWADVALTHFPVSRLRQLMDGRQRLSAFSARLFAHVAKESEADRRSVLCSTPVADGKLACRSTFTTWWMSSCFKLICSANSTMNINPLHALDQMGKDLSSLAEGVAPCEKCKKRVHLVLDATRRAVWADVPYAFLLKESDNQDVIFIEFVDAIKQAIVNFGGYIYV